MQHVFVWQRQWTGAVGAAVAEHGREFQELGVFGGEICVEGDGRCSTEKGRPDWSVLAAAGREVAPVIRVERLADTGAARQAVAGAVVAAARSFTAEAGAAGVAAGPVIVDYDCPQKRLPAYAGWLVEVRAALAPRRVVITALPSWLGEADLPALLDRCDGWILQLHSFDLTRLNRQPQVCDPVQAVRWTAQAEKLGRLYSVALATYSATAGLDADWKRVGLALEGPSPAWPPGTLQVELGSDPAGLAALVAEWRRNRPAHLVDLWWYRLPVATDTRNWRWPTLAAVMAGRVPAPRWQVVAEGTNPIDLTLLNTGEGPGPPPQRLVIRWPGHAPAAADALPGWAVTTVEGNAMFSPSPEASARAIIPGSRCALGWIRHHEAVPSVSVLQITVEP